MVPRFFLVALLCLSTRATAQVPSIIVGTGKAGYSGDGLQASVAQLRVPSDLFVSADGTIYIADTANNRIRRVEPGGTIETIAGNGRRVQSSDGELATEVGIMSPSSVVVDGAGNVYYAEWTGHRVRKIDTTGRITTVAGNGEPGYVGENLPATETSLWTPSRIFLDGKGNLYIAEWHAHRIRIVTPDGTISTIAGNGNKGFSGDGGPAELASLDRPNGLFVTRQGEIYISDLGNHRIRRVDTDGVIHTVAGNGMPQHKGDGGPATDASLNAPAGIFVDDGGNLYISDTRNGKVRKVDPTGTMSTWVDGLTSQRADGTPRHKPLRNPNALFVDDKGHLYITDGTMNTVIRIPNVAVPTSLAVAEPGTVGYAVSRSWWQSLMDLFR